MAFKRMAALVLLAGVAVTSQAAAQQDWELTLSARGGGYTGFRTLTGPGNGDFKSMGTSLGGGIGFQVAPAVAFRIDATRSASELQRNGVASGTSLHRMHFDAGVQVQLPGTVMPYLIAGLGVVVMEPEGTPDKDRTMPTANAGVGVRYDIPGTHFALQGEAKGWLYAFPEFGSPIGGFSGNQFDLGLTAGVTYRIPLR